MNTAEKKTYTVTEVAKVLGIGRNLAYQLVKTGEINSIRLGDKRIVVPKTAIEHLLTQKIS